VLAVGTGVTITDKDFLGWVVGHEGDLNVVECPGVFCEDYDDGNFRRFESALKPTGAVRAVKDGPAVVVAEDGALSEAEFLAWKAEWERVYDGGPRPIVPHVWEMSTAENPKDAVGVHKAPLRFVPPALAIIASDALADGADKYGAFNWRENAVRLSVYLEAIERHLLALRDGQDRAEDSGHLHIAHIAACCAIIADADAFGNLIDDRPTPGPAADLLRERDQS